MRKMIALILMGSILTGTMTAPVVVHAEQIPSVEMLFGSDQSDYGTQEYVEDALSFYQAKESAEEEKPILDPTQVNIMIDPGHAAYYNPSPVYKGYYESVMTWKLSNYLKEELELLGARADLTKTSLEDDPDLIPRGNKSEGYDFFISVHSNAADYTYMDKPIAICYQNLAWTTIDDTSREIGMLITKKVASVMDTKQDGEIWQRLSDNDRDKNGVHDDEWYGVLCGARYVGTPGILMEHSFHTNWAATVWLSNESNLHRLAKEEAAVIYNYFYEKKQKELAETTTTPKTAYDAPEPVVVEPIPHEDGILGDVDGNGKIDLTDVSCVLRYYAKSACGLTPTFLTSADEVQEAWVVRVADFDENGIIDIDDAVLILKAYAAACVEES